MRRKKNNKWSKDCGDQQAVTVIHFLHFIIRDTETRGSAFLVEFHFFSIKLIQNPKLDYQLRFCPLLVNLWTFVFSNGQGTIYKTPRSLSFATLGLSGLEIHLSQKLLSYERQTDLSFRWGPPNNCQRTDQLTGGCFKMHPEIHLQREDRRV